VAGEAERLLGRFGRRYAVAVRVATLVPIGAIALLRSSSEELAGTVLAVAVAVAWTCGYGWWLRRTDGHHAGLVPVAMDVAVLLGICLSVFWTNAVAETNTGWLRLLVTFACVTLQWHTAPLTGIVAALVASGGMLAIVNAAGLRLTVSQAWVLAVAVLSRAAWVLVTRAAERADRMAAEAERARREAAVAAAVRAEELELANSLHDTAATTLLMVGTGQVPSGASWLAPQARRDLARLRSDGGLVPGRADLVDLLRADLDASHLAVELDAPRRLPLPFDVASAIAGAVQEALNNVRRHAGTDRAAVLLCGDPQALQVDIIDEGKGFAVNDGASGSATRRGLRESVLGRMSRIGGVATITSVEGAGTVVRLEWQANRE
jgi:signal transduction histidine kinase